MFTIQYQWNLESESREKSQDSRDELRQRFKRSLRRYMVFEKCVIVWNRPLEFQFLRREYLYVYTYTFFNQAIWNRIVRVCDTNRRKSPSHVIFNDTYHIGTHWARKPKSVIFPGKKRVSISNGKKRIIIIPAQPPPPPPRRFARRQK